MIDAKRKWNGIEAHGVFAERAQRRADELAKAIAEAKALHRAKSAEYFEAFRIKGRS